LEEPRTKLDSSSGAGPADAVKGLFRRGFLGRGVPKEELPRDGLTHPSSCCSDDEGDSSTAEKRASRWFSPLRKRQGAVDPPIAVEVEALDGTEPDAVDARNRLGTWSYFTRTRAKPAAQQRRTPVPPERFVGSPEASPTHSATGGLSTAFNRSASTSI
jgi:hypothetical protein